MSTAHETAAAALEAAATALRAVAAEAGAYAVGDILNASKLSDLPVGLIFKDKDGDRWKVTGPGKYVWASSGQEAGLLPSNYQPLTVDEVPTPTAPPTPTPTPTPELSDFKVGDRVRASGLSYWGSNCDGKEGTVSRIDRADNLVAVNFDGMPAGKMYRPFRLTKLADAPTPVADLKIGDKVRITAPINSYRGHVGHVGTLTRIETSVRRDVSQTGARYAVDGLYAGAVEKVEAAPVAAPPRTRFTAGRTEILAEHSYGDTGAFLRLSERNYSTGTQVVAAHLSRQQTRDLIATLQKIVDTPRP